MMYVYFAASFFCCFMVYRTTELLTGLKRKHSLFFTAAVLALPALAPVIRASDSIPQTFLLRLGIILLCIFGRLIANSVILGCIRLDVLYITLCSFITSQTYGTVFLTYLKKKSVANTVSLTAEAFVLLAFMIIAEKKHIEIPLRQALGSVPRKQYVLIFIMAFLVNLFMTSAKKPEFHNIAQAVMIPTMIGFVAVLLMTVHSTASVSRHQAVAAVLTEQMEGQVEYYKRINQLHSEFRSFRHDLKNHFICLRSLIEENENEKAAEYINDIEYMSAFEKKEFDTGNIIVDCLLSSKNAKAKEAGASIVFSGFAPTMGIRDADCCVIFSNALDNAVEACSKDDSGQPKEIRIESDFRQGYYFLKITNPMFEQLSYKGHDRLATSKADKELHGFGISNIVSTVNKYDGTVDITAGDGVFCLDIVIHLNSEHL